MKRCKFKKMDVFAGDKSYGNPAAVFYPDEILTSEEMQKIGYELKDFVSEAVFIFKSPLIFRLPSRGYWSSETISVTPGSDITTESYRSE